MNKFFFAALIISFFTLSSCANEPPKPSDATADTELGLTHEEERGEAEQTLEELKEAQLQEQRRRLERVVTEPVIQSSET